MQNSHLWHTAGCKSGHQVPSQSPKQHSPISSTLPDAVCPVSRLSAQRKHSAACKSPAAVIQICLPKDLSQPMDAVLNHHPQRPCTDNYQRAMHAMSYSRKSAGCIESQCLIAAKQLVHVAAPCTASPASAQDVTAEINSCMHPR